MIDYLLVALLVCYIDAVACYVMKIKFRAAISIIGSLLWPVALPLEIYVVAKLTAKNPSISWKQGGKR